MTADQAFARACANNSKILSIKDVHEVLTRGAADLGKEGEDAAEKAFDGPNFDTSIQKILDQQLTDLAFLYVGDLAEGEVYDPQLINITEINNWSAISLNEDFITIILTISADISIEVQYEDRDDAIYDKEDGVYFGAESASRQFIEQIEVDYLVEIKRDNGSARNGEMLTREISIRGPFDYD